MAVYREASLLPVGMAVQPGVCHRASHTKNPGVTSAIATTVIVEPQSSPDG